MLPVWADRFEAVRREPSDVQGHLDRLVELASQDDVSIIIELGVRFGVSSTAFLYALETKGYGHLWSVDVDNRWNVQDPLWTFVLGEDLDPNVLAVMPEKADIVFVDTDHRYELTKDEIRAYAPRVRAGGWMVFHDTEMEQFDHHAPGTEPPFPVRKAVWEWIDTLKAHSFPHTVEHHTHTHGLTIIQLGVAAT